MACRLGPQSAIEHIDKFYKYLGIYVSVSEKEAKFIFEMNISDKLSVLVLSYSCADLNTIMLCAQWISSIQQHYPAQTNQNNYKKQKQNKKK